jgi:hypothetical protein
MTAKRYRQAAMMLLNGMVLMAGGNDGGAILSSADLYDSSSGTFTATGSMTVARYLHTAMLLPNGTVLITGGYNSTSTYLSSAELYNVGLGFNEAWRPAITSATPITLNGNLVLVGSGFSGYGSAEASGGTTNSSASNYPLVQLRNIDNGQMAWLAMDSFSSGGYSSRAITNFATGPAMVTVYVNGIPSMSQYVTVNEDTVVPSYLLSISIPAAGPGIGSGQVTSDIGGIVCTSGGSGICSASYLEGTTLTLSATTASDSTFNGWAADCTGVSPCLLAMTKSRNVSAQFGLGPGGLGPVAKILFTGFSSVNDAYDAAGANDTIKVVDGTHAVGDLSLDHIKNTKLEGGYNASFSSLTGQPTVLQGKLTIKSGSLRVNRVKVKQ